MQKLLPSLSQAPERIFSTSSLSSVWEIEQTEDLITPTQSTTHLPQSGTDDLSSNYSFYSVVDSTLSTNSTESFETADDASHISFPSQTAANERSRFFDSEVVEPPSADGPPSAQPDDRLPELLYPMRFGNPNVSTPSICSSWLGFIPNGSLESFSNISDESSSASPASRTLPSHLPEEDQELMSDPSVREWEVPGNWFQRNDYDTESLRSGEP